MLRITGIGSLSVGDTTRESCDLVLILRRKKGLDYEIFKSILARVSYKGAVNVPAVYVLGAKVFPRDKTCATLRIICSNNESVNRAQSEVANLLKKALERYEKDNSIPCH